MSILLTLDDATRAEIRKWRAKPYQLSVTQLAKKFFPNTSGTERAIAEASIAAAINVDWPGVRSTTPDRKTANASSEAKKSRTNERKWKAPARKVGTSPEYQDAVREEIRRVFGS